MVRWIGQKNVRKIAEANEAGYHLVEFRQMKARLGKLTEPDGVPVILHYREPDEEKKE